jgi:hypothetical protein
MSPADVRRMTYRAYTVHRARMDAYLKEMREHGK